MTYSREYLATLESRRWRVLRRLCFAISWGRDCVLPILPAQECDHLTYRRLGQELPLIDVVPLSRWTHRRVVTPLRARFGRSVVNPPLRFAFGCWLALDFALALLLVWFVVRHCPW